ncbi:MAG: hypothetical protein HOQ11_14325 [Gemmatimonadaceae bacterium]|nr:hypothetical protein [Gemmatimonadaceae bacterium]NUQ91357.1 hypothetical protein [Gemmatimonadaceae bacterium]NUR18061.1 hypothetical protein [Gemmatimonadaceae bacterium]NUS98578.1 hypothetical protein [Gemmatimonadaceae bacterium]
MAGQERSMEGDNEERRHKAKEARDRGESPSAAGVTTGASKQMESAKPGDSHEDRLEKPHKGKANRGHDDESRPRSRPDRRDER